MRKKLKPIPDVGYLNRALLYNPDTGMLYWRRRNPSDFKSGVVPAAVRCQRWNTMHAGNPAFRCLNGHGYFVGGLNRVQYFAHRIIFKMCTGNEPEAIDHINGDKLDNRITNLRAVSIAENCRNLPRPKDNKTGFPGVSMHPKSNRWRAQINVAGKTKHLGTFDTKQEAINAKRRANEKYDYHPNHGRNP